MALNNFLYSGFDFNEDEDLFKFKIKLFNTVLMIGIAATVLFSTLSLLGIDSFSPIHEFSLLLYAVVCTISIVMLRRDKGNYPLLLNFFFIAGYLVFAEALVFVPEDPFRMIWFYILVYLVFVFQTPVSGFVYTGLSVGTIVVYEMLTPYPDVELAVFSATLGLIIMSSLFYVHTKKFNDYEKSFEQRRVELSLLASTDMLTGISNRHQFIKKSQDTFEAVISETDKLHIILLDIDYFKRVNDTYGHLTGDKVLIEFSKTIQKYLHKGMTFARIGGEEFAILSTTLNIEETKIFAEKLRAAIERMVVNLPEQKVSITTSIGIGSHTKTTDTFLMVFDMSDKMLYKAKEEGRNRVYAS